MEENRNRNSLSCNLCSRIRKVKCVCVHVPHVPDSVCGQTEDMLSQASPAPVLHPYSHCMCV